MHKKVLVTGANGFVGKNICTYLSHIGCKVIAAVRESSIIDNVYETLGGLSLDSEETLRKIVRDMDVVIHLAARVHIINETESNPLSEFRKVNVIGTRNLANACVKEKVKRFIYMSSIKVNGEETGHRTNGKQEPYCESDIPIPQDPYGISKLEAEQTLIKISRKSGLEIVVIRPPLVYGPCVGGNFLRLLHLVYRGIPLPLGQVQNRRDMIGVANLANFICVCLDHPKAAGEVFLVSDGNAMSSSELIQRIGEIMGRPPRLTRFPRSALKLVGLITGKSAEIDRLTSSLEIDISKAKQILGWNPPVEIDTELSRTVAWFLRSKG